MKDRRNLSQFYRTILALIIIILLIVIISKDKTAIKRIKKIMVPIESKIALFLIITILIGTFFIKSPSYRQSTYIGVVALLIALCAHLEYIFAPFFLSFFLDLIIHI